MSDINLDQGYSSPGHARDSCGEAGSGLAAWQQVVLAAYIEKHISESITVRTLARFVYLSSYRFCRAFGLVLGFGQTSSFSAGFRNVTGITPTEYRRTQR